MRSNAVKSIRLDVDWAARTILPIEFDGEELQLEAHAYQGKDVSSQALALVNRGTAADDPIATVRVHSGCVTGDIFHSLRCDCYPQLKASLRHITRTPNGVLIYVPYHEGRGIGLVKKIQAYALQDQGMDTVDANVAVGAPIDARDYELSADILFDLGFPEIRLMTNNPTKVDALSQYGIRIKERVPVVSIPSRHNVRYLNTKKERMAHHL